MSTTGNIIAIDKLEADRSKAQAAFKEFMNLSQQCFNEHSQADPKRYVGRSPNEIEKDTRDILLEVAPSTAFANAQIELKSGHFFPDIVAGTHYGVEVKTTKDDKWTSTGNSVLEGVSDVNIRDIYIMFANLGCKKEGILIPEFRFRPYQECLYNIAVTHAPRYQIDMNLPENATIFTKMNIEYDTFKLLDDNEKISTIRSYYREKAKKEGKKGMPWWMGEDNEVNLSFLNDNPAERKEELKTRSLILFSCFYDDDLKKRYKDVALWLCSYYSVLCSSIRDMYSAGGKYNTEYQGQKVSYPHIVGELIQRSKKIKELLDNPDEKLKSEIEEYWKSDYSMKHLFDNWIDKIESWFSKSATLKGIPIRELLIDAISK